MIKDAKIVNNKNTITNPEIILLTSETWDQWILEQEPEPLPAPTHNYFENSNNFCRQNSTNSLTSFASHYSDSSDGIRAVGVTFASHYSDENEDSGIGSSLNSPIFTHTNPFDKYALEFCNKHFDESIIVTQQNTTLLIS